MPILNNIPRKHSTLIKTGDSSSDVFGPTAHPSDAQHTSLGFEGASYESPFTHSGVPPLGTQRNLSTQVQLRPMQVEQPGVIVRTHHFTKVPPHYKTVLNKTRGPEAIVRRTGGPAKAMDTPTNPNAKPKVAPPIRALHPQRSGDNHTSVQGSYLHTQTEPRTLNGNGYNDKPDSRWAVIKRGAAG